MKKFYSTLCLVLAMVLTIHNSWAQGSTTASMSGVVKEQKGSELPGATVIAVHQPTNTQYVGVTNAEGRYSIQNMRVGGPYTITVKYIGYQDKVTQNISLTLGQTLSLNITMLENSQTLGEVQVVSRRDNVINSERTGAATTIRSEQIATLPTVSRQINDFVRLTPQADVKGTSISIAGINNRFNQLTIDGAVSNDVFGLSGTGTNGGSTGTSPISLDAIEQFNVQIAPFDVRLGGFAGGGISAVTRSGTNDFSGSAYYFTRNQNLAGKTPGALLREGEEATRFENFTDRQYGFRVGGPIIKDKLFFFLNAEKTENTTPLSFAPGQTGSEITLDEVRRVAERATALGYDPGAFDKQERTEGSEKVFARLDWNLSDKHKLTARYSYTFGETVQLSRSPRSFTFANGGILRESKTNSAVVEFNSRFSNSISNNFVAGYTSVREPRTAPGAPFPRVFINLGGSRNISLGTEAFSAVNQLDQDIFTLTNNLTIFKGKHTITLGTHNELYDMYNAFIGQAYGDYQFTNSPASDVNPATGKPYTAIENWERGLANSYTYQYSRTSDPREGAKFGAMQLGFYGQDEYQATDDLKLTAGLRLDIPIYLDEPLENEDFNNSNLAKQYNVRTNKMPKAAYMWSPRLGFNWDVKGDRTTQLRGGTGIFTSRFPFVWAGGAFTQSGVLLDQNRINAPAGAAPNAPFIADPYNQTKRTTVSQPGGNITVLNENFKVPQIFRTNIAVDQQLPFGFIGTAEFMYSKNLNAFNFRNINLVDPNMTLEGADNRVLYPASNTRILPNYTEIVYIENVNKGYSWTATAQIQKSFSNGFYGSLAYSYTESKDLNPGTSSQNHSNYYRVASVNGSNNLEVGYSPFNVGSRIVGAVSYRREYLKNLATAISVFYTGQSGTPFSYIVNGDVNRSTFSSSNSNHYSLIYIPRNASEIRFAGTEAEQAAQWNEFNAFIENNDYLSSRRGQYAERNGARTPFTHQFDVKLSQDLFTDIAGKRNTLQFTLDILNVGNLINKDWGQRYAYGNSYFDNTFQVLDLDRFDGRTPVYKFARKGTDLPYTVSDAPIGGSRWVGQVGLRYIFN